MTEKGSFIFSVPGTLLRFCQSILTSQVGIFENALGFSPQLSARLVSDTAILPWLLARVSAKSHDENRGYASEVLSILLQDNKANRLLLGAKGGVETLLKVLSVSDRSCLGSLVGLIVSSSQQFRKRDPVDADETEFMENIFDTLCSALIESETKRLFLQEEGVDLMVIIMKYISNYPYVPFLISLLNDTAEFQGRKCKPAPAPSKCSIMHCQVPLEHQTAKRLSKLSVSRLYSQYSWER